MKTKRAIFVLFFLLVLNSFLFAELTRPQLWAISLSGILTENNNSFRNSLNTSSMDQSGRDTWFRVLDRDWGITSREGLLETIANLERGGHAASFSEIKDILFEIMFAPNQEAIQEILNKVQWDETKYNRFRYVSANWSSYYSRTLKAWDLGRIISLLRWGYNVGFLQEKEAWDMISYYAELTQPMYNSWRDYGNDYLLGRLFWASGFGEEETYQRRTQPLFDRLMNTYWNWLEWDIDLNNDEAAPVETIRFMPPLDNVGRIQYRTNDPDMHNRYTYNRMENPSPDPNIYECSVNKISGSDNFGFGIMFCIDDSGENLDFYRLFMTTNGRFVVAKRFANRWEAAPLRWQNSPFINRGFNVYNNIRVERSDIDPGKASFRVFINGNLAGEFTDDNPINGRKIAPVVSVATREGEFFPNIPVDVRWDY